ncbi:CBS domain-containing protein [Desulfobaculum xiamenense]|uniref:CBS domain-containing protein n=1 Tax=Desulfobaculum xiamenense TaxID=995050 RepID=A0A846QJU6_9BACT|nr:CBS domain-containing protein [Desulfobaculum xiamenense]NJB66752.1 CBS domain-containing protein [Desulfobaculum xiamenense]
MLKAKDIMTPNPITLYPDDDIVSAAQTMLEKRINGIPVLDEGGSVVGILCQSDLVAQQKKLKLPSVFTLLDGMIPFSSTRDFERELQKMTAMTVAQAMTPNPATVSPETPLDEVASLIVERKFHTLPVVENGHLVGIIGKEDILRTLLPKD